MDTLTKFTVPGIGLLLTLGFGVWLSHLGKPYNGLLFNVHKLIALGFVIVMVVQLVRMLKQTAALPLSYGLFGLAALCVVTLFASGALLSLGKLDQALMHTLHKIAAGVIVPALVLAVYWLGR